MSRDEQIHLSRWAAGLFLAGLSQMGALVVWGTMITADVRHLQDSVNELKQEIRARHEPRVAMESRQ
jgi:hypothetical protein